MKRKHLSSHLQPRVNNGESLLERAKQITDRRTTSEFTDEQLELVTAWMKDEVSLTQITQVLRLKSTGNVYAFLARGARMLYRRTH